MNEERALQLKKLEASLKPKEKLFIEELEIDGAKADAALRAGFGKGHRRSAATAASRILQKENVREYRALRAVMEFEELGITKETVLSETAKVYRRCMQKEEVLAWDPDEKEWLPTGEYKFDSKGALKALEMMGESIGLFKGELEKEQKVDVNINVVDKIEKKE